MASYSFPWDMVNSLVQDYIIPNVRDQFFLSNAFYYRAQRRLKMFSGGRSIVQPLVWKAEGGGGDWFSGVDVLDTTIRDPIQSATWQAKNAYVPISIDWDEEKKVMGPTMVRPLMETKGDIARNTAVDLIGTNLFNDGSEGKAITGLQFALKDYSGGAAPTMSYGGISRSSTVNTWWNHQGDDTDYAMTTSGGMDPLVAGEVQGVLNKMWAKIGRASGKTPSLMVSNWGAFSGYHNALSLNERYQRPQQNSDLAKAGFENLMFKNAAWVVDERAPRTAADEEKLYFLNEDTVRLCVHRDANMAFEPFRKPHNQMARVAFILWRGELIISEPRANGVISDIDTTAVS